jgi:DNA polymerase III subunit alpha
MPIFGKDRYFLELMDHGIETGKNLSDPDRFRFDGTGYYLKSTDGMYAVDSSDAWQEGCRNTLLVAEQIDTSGMFEPKNLMPKFDIPDGFTEVTWFKEEVRRGMERRFPGGIPDDRQKQADYEMDVIIQMGFPGYFLVVADFIMWAMWVRISYVPFSLTMALVRPKDSAVRRTPV